MNLPQNYDDSSIVSIVAYAKKLVGKSVADILAQDSLDINIKNKGVIGTIIEEYWFGIKPNSSPLPDFDKVGVELKIIPLIKQKSRLVVKERTKICSINYTTLVDETWQTSHVKEKLNKILFIYYLYDKDNIKNSTIKKIDLWKLNENNNEFIIKHDYLHVQQKIKEGYAHELSESLSKVLAASRSGSGGKDSSGRLRDLVSQPIKIHSPEALKRAFSLKQSFTNQRWNELSTKHQYESIIDALEIDDLANFEERIVTSINAYANKSIKEISDIFSLDISSRSKNKIATIIKKAIGFKSVKSTIKEFEQLGIIIKVVPVNQKNNYPFEAISFATMKLQEFVNEEWEDSTFREYLHKILIVPIYSRSKESTLDEKYMAKTFFWSPSISEEALIQKEWSCYQDEVLSGKCEVKKVAMNSLKGYKEVSALSKESQTLAIHMRPHGRDSTDRDIDTLGNSIVKQSFWLNKRFIQKLLEENNSLL